MLRVLIFILSAILKTTSITAEERMQRGRYNIASGFGKITRILEVAKIKL